MEIINKENTNSLNGCNKKLENLLLIWLYFSPILYLLTNILDASAVSLISYIINIIIFLYAFIIKRAVIQKRVMLFVLGYLVLVFLNAIVVSYPYYVLVEGISSFIIFLPAIYIISSKGFDYKVFLRIWSKYTLPLTFLLFILIFLYSKKLYHYGEFAYIVIPNVLVICYSFFNGYKKRLVLNIVLLFINLATILLFGGRISAMVAFLIIFFAVYLFSKHIKVKIVFTVCILFLSIIMGSLFFVNNFYKNAVEKVNQGLYSMNLSSRNFWLLEQQFNEIDVNVQEELNNNVDNDNKLVDNLYVTNRDHLYDISIDFIKINHGMPGGMGVIRNKTNGQFYYTHNFFLEIIIYFGVVGAILFLALIFLTLIKLYRCRNIFVFKICLYLGLTYSFISLMGGNMFQSNVSIMFLSLLFLYNKEQTDVDFPPILIPKKR